MSVRGTLSIGLVLILVVGSCSSSRQLAPRSTNSGNTLTGLEAQFNDVEVDEDFNPASLDDDEININKLIQEKKKQQSKKARFNSVSEPAFEAGMAETQQVQPGIADSLEIFAQEMVAGWRVQICALTDQVKAREVLKHAEDVFERYDNYKVYFTYDSPYYKVRIGDFTSRYLADRLLELATQNNFPDAWVVKTNVYKNFEMNHPEPFLNNTEELEKN